MSILSSSQPSSDEDSEMIAVLVAQRYIPAYTVVRPEWTTVRSLPRAYVPQGAFNAVKDLSGDKGQLVFKSAVALSEGEPLTRTVLTDLRKQNGLSSVLAPNKLAVTFAASNVRGVGGWVEPGDRIAIYKTQGEILGNSQPVKTTKLLFPSVEVIAVDKSRIGAAPVKKDLMEQIGDQGDAMITLSLNPIEAAAFIEAREQGHLSAALRPVGDDGAFTSEISQPEAKDVQ
jgi:pilus assembly protein CpaB